MQSNPPDAALLARDTVIVGERSLERDTPLNQNQPIITPSHSTENRAPTVVIESVGAMGIGVLLRELWEYRELFYFLVWRDIKIRYKQTVLGAAWAIIQPALMAALFTLFFGKLAKVPSEGVPYVVFVFAGLLPWTFLANTVLNGGNSLLTNSRLISKVYFPRVAVPASSIGSGLVDFGISGAVLAVLMSWYRIAPAATVLLIPLLVIAMGTLSLGLCTWFSALNIKYRDFRYALPFFVQLWMFATPVIYPSTLIPQKWQVLFMLNPAAAFIQSFRDALFGRSLDWSRLGIAGAVTGVILLSGMAFFHRVEGEFADIA